MFKTKKIVGLIALVAWLIAGVAVAAPGCGSAACSAVDAPQIESTEKSGISLAGGFKKLWESTGIYGFMNPKTAEQKHAEYEAACVKTVEAEISAGHFASARDVVKQGDAHHVTGSKLQALWTKIDVAEKEGHLSTGLLPEGAGQLVMIFIGIVLIWLAIAKGFEPLLLLPIGFGAILTNIPFAGIAMGPMPGQPAGFLYYFYTVGVQSGVFPLLIFMGVGAMTDFGPLLANPKTALLGAAAQFGIFVALLGALWLSGMVPAIDFSLQDAASIGIIGGADGPTAIFLSSRLSPNLLGAIAVAAYSYMALVPIIQPPIMKWLTTEEERGIVMNQLRHVSKVEKIVFPLTVLIICILLLPSATPLIGMLMLGNLMKESMVVDRLSDTAQNALINIVTIMLGLAVGSKLAADKFLNANTLGILALGLVAFMIGTACGVLLAKLMNKICKDQINPLIGSAGVSAVPMAARVANKVGLEANPNNFLLMHAMGPNVAGVIGSAVAAGVLLALVG
jgi:sodium ion-translocating decarboxylase beta subunit